MVEVPVLYITFCRPEYARHSFDAIKRAQPRKLYFYSNKAREDRPDEVRRNEEVRSFVKEIDWDCEVKIWFREEYVDIYTSLWGAMDWLFDNEEKGIVLEEDCVASLPFFTYCEKMLDYYEDDERVSIISGNNRMPQNNPLGEDCFLTRLVDIYGWASWAKVWKNLDKTMVGWKKNRFKLFNYFGRILPGIWYMIWWQRMYNIRDRFNPWDSIFAYNCVKNNTYGIVPVCNLVEDIGKYGVHHAKIENKGSFSMTSEIGDPGDTYDKTVKHHLGLCNKYDRKRFNAIFRRDTMYMFKKCLNVLKRK